MRKLTFAALFAVAASAFMACGNSTPKADLKNDIDSVSYAIGMAQTQGLKEYLVRGLGVDTAYMDEFFRGLNAGVNAGDDKKKTAYYAGLQIGQLIFKQTINGVNRQLFGEDSTQTISLKNFMAGFYTGTMDKKGLMDMQEAQAVWNIKMPAIRNRSLEKQYGENRAAGEKYLAEYAKKAGVKKLPDGVLYRVIKEGSGAMPKDTSWVRVNYQGKTIDGKVFDERKEPVALRANQVIPGWTSALTHMPVGSIWEVVIPQEMAYGNRETPQIKPFSALVFKIELVGLGRE